MPTTKKGYQIPFDAHGNMLSYAGYGVTTYKDPYVFTDTLTYTGYGRGRSAAHFYFEDTKGHTYSMFMSDFDDMVKSKKFNGGSITGTFTFVKKRSKLWHAIRLLKK
jgi:hypothetical protein